jgi:hypothetical protein
VSRQVRPSGRLPNHPKECTDLSDYEDNEALDRYDAADIDDRESIPEMTRGARLAAEADMQRRDKGLPGRRAGRRERMPGFLQSDDEDMDGVNEGPLAGVNPNRRRRQYDEVPNQDDVMLDDEVGTCFGISLVVLEADDRKCHLNTLEMSRRLLLPSGLLLMLFDGLFKNTSRVSS